MLKKTKKIKNAPKPEIVDLWQDDEKLLCKNKICKFNVNYLGVVEINKPKDEVLCKEAMTILLEKKKRIGELKISSYSIIFQDRSTNVLLLDQTLRKVIRCSIHSLVPFSFFYIAEDSTKDANQFYGFVSCKETSERIVNAIEYGMDLFNEREIEDIQHQRSNDFIPNDLQTIFKQATLTEKFQDPQSSIVSHNIPIKCSKTFSDLKSIPRPKGSRVEDKKSSFDNFPKLYQEDMFKSHNSPSKSLDSNLGISVIKSQNEGTYVNDLEWCNFSTQDKLQQILNINEAFHTNKFAMKMPQNIIKNFNESNFKENDNDQKSRYDSLKNLNSQVASGWSEDLVKVDEPKPTTSKSFNNFIDEIIISDLFNINPFRTQERRTVLPKKLN